MKEFSWERPHDGYYQRPAAEARADWGPTVGPGREDLG